MGGFRGKFIDGGDDKTRITLVILFALRHTNTSTIPFPMMIAHPLHILYVEPPPAEVIWKCRQNARNRTPCLANASTSEELWLNYTSVLLPPESLRPPFTKLRTNTHRVFFL